MTNIPPDTDEDYVVPYLDRLDPEFVNQVKLAALTGFPRHYKEIIFKVVDGIQTVENAVMVKPSFRWNDDEELDILNQDGSVIDTIPREALILSDWTPLYDTIRSNLLNHKRAARVKASRKKLDPDWKFLSLLIGGTLLLLILFVNLVVMITIELLSKG